ncbi:Lcl C-terminal domain-containing protein [Nitrospira sp. Nam74]
MANRIQRYGFGVMCLLAWVVFSQEVPASFPSQGDPAVSSGSQRFVAASDGTVVKDLQTGFTWEQSPDFSYSVWTEAIAHCKAKTVGGHTGWRLPSIKELSTLIDSSQKDPALPSGHPFGNNKSSIFWSSTPSETDDMVAWHVSFFTGEAVTDQKSQTRRAWCMLAEKATPRP